MYILNRNDEVIRFLALMNTLTHIFHSIASLIAEADAIVANDASKFSAKRTAFSSMGQQICITKYQEIHLIESIKTIVLHWNSYLLTNYC